MSSFDVGAICWVKCGVLHWPAQVVDTDDLPEDVKEDMLGQKREVKLVLKFFNEDGYEFIYDLKTIFPYNGPKKEDFIKKGLVKCRTQANTSYFAKFPKDIVLCEEMTDGDPGLLEKAPYAEEKREKVDYSAHFGTPEEKAKKKGKATAAGSGGRKRKAESEVKASPNKRQITHPRFQGNSDHKVKIMAQPSTPYHLDLISKESKVGNGSSSSPAASGALDNSNGGSPSLPGGGGGGGKYQCPFCDFSTNRLNVLILHQKACTAATESAKGGAKPTANRRSAGSPQTPKSRGTSAKSPRATPTRATPTSAAKKRGGGRATPQAKKETPTGKSTPSSRQAKKEPAKESPAKAAKKEEEPAPAAPTSTPTPAKKRLTKKEKEELAKEQAKERERKEQERKKILGDWSEEEEEEEKKQMRDIMGPYVDSSDEENEFLGGDDNVHNNDYEGEDEIEAQERKEREEEERKKSLANRTVEEEKRKREEARKREEEQRKKEEEELEEAKRKAKEAEEARRKAEEEERKRQAEEEAKAAEREKARADEYDFDIGKALEETAVPELPDILTKKKNGTPQPPVVAARAPRSPSPQKRKVSFGAAKEFTNTKLTLVQPESNLDDPMMVDDEFDEFARFSDVAAAKPILKKPDSLPPPVPQQQAAKSVSIARDAEAKAEGENGAGAEAAAVPEAATAAPAAGGDAGQQQETYLILVDDGSGAVDSLNSQTLYIDPSQLENGNMVLMTNDGVPVSAQGVVAAPAAATGGGDGAVASHEQILAAASVQPAVVAPNAVGVTQQVAIAPTATTMVTDSPIVTAAVAPATN